MLDLEQIDELLAWNAVLLQVELQLGLEGSFQRLTELMLHRSVLKDCKIELLNASDNASRKAG